MPLNCRFLNTEPVRREAADTRHITLRWTPVDNATGYIVRWGTSPKSLTQACMVYGDNTMDARFYNRDDEYFFEVTAFNECGFGGKH